MVKYKCDICKKDYSSLKEAEDCEKKGVINSDVKPGLLFSHKKVERGYLVLYGEHEKIGHEKSYHAEEFLVWDSLICPVQSYLLFDSKLSNLENFVLSKDEEVNKLNKLIEDNFRGISLIKAYLHKYGADKLHNSFKK